MPSRRRARVRARAHPEPVPSSTAFATFRVDARCCAPACQSLDRCSRHASPLPGLMAIFAGSTSVVESYSTFGVAFGHQRTRFAPRPCARRLLADNAAPYERALEEARRSVPKAFLVATDPQEVVVPTA